MKRQLKLSSASLPSKMDLLFYELGSLIEYNSNMAASLDRVELNPNQQKLFDILDTSQVPPKQWIHMLCYGGVGGGKTYGILLYILQRAMLRYPGVRVLVVRSTLKDLKNSIYLDVKDILNRYGIPYKKNDTDLKIVLENGSEMWMCSDKALTPASSDKADSLGGTQFSIVVVEEADSISEELAKTIPGRMRQNIGDIRKVIFYDCNPPSRQHWTYRWWHDEDENTLGPHDAASRFRICIMPSEGNVQHLGEDYLAAMTEDYGRDPIFYRRMRLGQFGPNTKGNPIYAKEFSEERHISKVPLTWNRGCPLVRGWDFGYEGTGLVVLQDDTKVRRIKFLRSIVKQQCILDIFLDEILPELNRQFPGAQWVDYIDPAGIQQNTNGLSCIEVMRQHGLRPMYRRVASVAYGINVFMKQLRLSINREPVVIIDPCCETLIEALAGGYANKKGVADKEINPVKDGLYDHIADAARYAMVNIRDYKDDLSPYAEPARNDWKTVGSGDRVGPHIINPGERAGGRRKHGPPVMPLSRSRIR